MNKSTRTILMAAALAGLYAGSMAVQAHATTDAGKPAPAGEKAKEHSCAGKEGCPAKDKPKSHDCAGKNECKGKGGCKSGDNGCAGKNSCKGKGGCASSHAPKDKKTT